MDEAEEAILRAIADEAAEDGAFASSDEEDEEETEEAEQGTQQQRQEQAQKPEQGASSRIQAHVEAPPLADGVQFDAKQYELVSNKKTRTDPDGTVFEWDEERKAWFPLYQEGQAQAQQSIYDAHWANETSKQLPPKPPAPREGPAPKKGKRKRGAETTASSSGGADPALPVKKTVIYVSGLPTDSNSIEEMAEFFKKCGIIKVDFLTGELKIKLYQDDKGQLKGDACVSYLKAESVDLAIKLLDGVEYRPSYQISVQVAEFSDKGNQPKKKRTKAEKKKIQQHMKQLEKKLEWYDEGLTSSKYQRIVILKHMFTPEDLERDPGQILDLKEDIRGESERLGHVVSVTVYDKHPEGVCSVKFKEIEHAEACVELMDGRYFAGRQIEASIYDGTVKYNEYLSSKNETEDDEEERLKRYGDWLEKQQQQQQQQQQQATAPLNTTGLSMPAGSDEQLQREFAEQPATPP